MELHMNPFKGRHFQRDIILWAVRWYCKYGISYRELQEMLAERGVNVDHSTIYRWVQRYAPEMENGCAGTGVTFRSLPVAHG
jgi:IS6 family transposase